MSKIKSSTKKVTSNKKLLNKNVTKKSSTKKVTKTVVDNSALIRRTGYSLNFVKTGDPKLEEFYASGKVLGEVHVTTQDITNDQSDEIIIVLKD